MYDNYYFLEEFHNSGVYAIERKMSGIMTAIKVRSGEQRLNRDGEEMLDSFIATQPKDINRVRRFSLSSSATKFSASPCIGLDVIRRVLHHS